MSLFGFWRRKPREVLDCSLRPTRRELLTRYMPLSAPPLEILAGDNPGRAIEYWCGSLAILVTNELVAKSGEADLTVEKMRNRLPRKNWQQQWLDGEIDLYPGSKMLPAVEARAANLAPKRPRDPKARRGPGRPRKTPATQEK